MCRSAKIGCVACKKALSTQINILLEPIIEKRAYYASNRQRVKEIINTGSEKANRIGNQMM